MSSNGEGQIQQKTLLTLCAELELDEEGTRVSLTIVDTPGFGDQIDNESAFGEIVGYLERQYDDILAEESRIKRNPRFRDNRVHALLYFITPTGHGLRELDIELMKRLSPRVNVIPVIGKADSLTPAELAESKKLVMEDIEHYRIPVYNFPYDIEEDDEDTVEENAELRGLMPFAIVGSEEVMEVNGRRVRARHYPWGTVEVDNPRHSDFLAIRSALLHSHLADLKEITHDFLYENYRTEKLSKSVDGGVGKYACRVGSLLAHANDLSAPRIRPSTPKTSPTNRYASRRSSSVVKRRSCVTSRPKYNERSTRRDRNCWRGRASYGRSKQGCSENKVTPTASTVTVWQHECGWTFYALHEVSTESALDRFYFSGWSTREVITPVPRRHEAWFKDGKVVIHLIAATYGKSCLFSARLHNEPHYVRCYILSMPEVFCG